MSRYLKKIRHQTNTKSVQTSNAETWQKLFAKPSASSRVHRSIKKNASSVLVLDPYGSTALPTSQTLTNFPGKFASGYPDVSVPVPTCLDFTGAGILSNIVPPTNTSALSNNSVPYSSMNGTFPVSALPSATATSNTFRSHPQNATELFESYLNLIAKLRSQDDVPPGFAPQYRGSVSSSYLAGQFNPKIMFQPQHSTPAPAAASITSMMDSGHFTYNASHHANGFGVTSSNNTHTFKSALNPNAIDFVPNAKNVLPSEATKMSAIGNQLCSKVILEKSPLSELQSALSSEFKNLVSIFSSEVEQPRLCSQNPHASEFGSFDLFSHQPGTPNAISISPPKQDAPLATSVFSVEEIFDIDPKHHSSTKSSIDDLDTGDDFLSPELEAYSHLMESAHIMDSGSSSVVSSISPNSIRFKDQLYKTEMCRNLMELGYCKFEAECRFAHSKNELRKCRPRQVKYKTVSCCEFEKDICYYGARCWFIHSQTDQNELIRQMSKEFANMYFNWLIDTVDDIFANFSMDQFNSLVVGCGYKSKHDLWTSNTVPTITV